jgi:predicted NBD/HSP70 family sugar kinase
MIVKAGGKLCRSCGQRGCLESYVSGKSFKEIYEVGPSKCDDAEVWEKYAHDLAPGIVNLVAMWGPDIIVLGGSISKKFEPFFKEPLIKKLEEEPLFDIPPIVKSVLGDDSGLYGGFLYLKQVLGA